MFVCCLWLGHTRQVPGAMAGSVFGVAAQPESWSKKTLEVLRRVVDMRLRALGAHKCCWANCRAQFKRRWRAHQLPGGRITHSTASYTHMGRDGTALKACVCFKSEKGYLMHDEAYWNCCFCSRERVPYNTPTTLHGEAGKLASWQAVSTRSRHVAAREFVCSETSICYMGLVYSLCKAHRDPTCLSYSHQAHSQPDTQHSQLSGLRLRPQLFVGGRGQARTKSYQRNARTHALTHTLLLTINTNTHTCCYPTQSSAPCGCVTVWLKTAHATVHVLVSCVLAFQHKPNARGSPQGSYVSMCWAQAMSSQYARSSLLLQV